MIKITVNVGTKVYDFTDHSVGAIQFAVRACETQETTEAINIQIEEVTE